MRAALLAFALSLVCLATSSAEPQRPKPTQRDQQTREPQRGTESTPLFVSGEVTITKDKTEAEGDIAEREAKSHIDESLVRYTFWLAVTTALLFVAAAVQAGLFVWQLRLIGRGEATAETVANAAKSSADASLLSLRPWMSCEVEIGGPLEFKEDGNAKLPLIFIMKNVGKTPAMSVRLEFPTINLVEPGVETSLSRLQRRADLSRGLPVKGGAIAVPGNMPITNPSGTLLFPEGVFVEQIILPINVAEIAASRQEAKNGGVNFWAEVVVLVTYVYNLAPIRADTGFIYELKTKDGVPLKFGVDVPMGDLRLEPHSMWGGFAT